MKNFDSVPHSRIAIYVPKSNFARDNLHLWEKIEVGMFVTDLVYN